MNQEELISIILNNAPANAPALLYIRTKIEEYLSEHVEYIENRVEIIMGDLDQLLIKRIDGSFSTDHMFNEEIEKFIHSYHGPWSQKAFLRRALDTLNNIDYTRVPSRIRRRKHYSQFRALFNNCYRIVYGTEYEEDLAAERASRPLKEALIAIKEGRYDDAPYGWGDAHWVWMSAFYDNASWWKEYSVGVWDLSWDNDFPGASGGHWIDHLHGAYISWGSDADEEGPYEDGDIIDVFGRELLLKNGDAVEQGCEEEE